MFDHPTVLKTILFLALLSITSPQAIGAPVNSITPGPYVAGAVIEMVGDDGALKHDGADAWIFTRKVENARSMRVELHVSAPNIPVNVEIRGGSSGSVQRLSVDQNDAGKSIWSNPVLGETISIRVLGRESAPPAIKVEAVVVESKDAFAPESIIPPNELRNVFQYFGDAVDTVRRVHGAVGKISFISEGFSLVCTGFLVSDNVVMTNEHCFNDQYVCNTATFTLGYHIGIDKSLSFGSDFRCTRVIYSDFDLDFTLFQVEGAPGKQYGVLDLAAASVAGEQKVLLIQHPGGRPKMVSGSNCRIIKWHVPGRRILSDDAHTCDTAGGSSGSPIIGYDGKVVALHHLGRDKAGQFVDVNRSVDIGLIVDILKKMQIDL
ncbi:trypsin-like serine peptidase [Sinorhizobium medicae]|uniref:trypsin-like serine peptidase n=1 Tax=Sinorhizobium medicae TaxID=110321 RepID=UPI000FDBC7DF|nr:serine protease [Sinorhizobium medicae]RVO72914.1 serine protease [Sinorhizobium medicae]